MPSKFEKIIEDIKAGVVSHEQNKKELIESARDALLEVNYPKDRICSKICEELKGYVKARYIREVLEQQYKDQAKVRTPKIKSIVGVTNSGETVVDSKPVYNPRYAAVAKASREVETNNSTRVLDNTEKLEEVQHSLREAKDVIAEQNRVINRLNSERELHTTVSLNPDKYMELLGFIKQKAKRIFLDFDDNMSVKDVRASL